MRKLKFSLALAAAFAITPALACGMMQQAAATSSAGAASTAAAAAGGMCGRPTPVAAQAQSPTSQSGQPAAGGCSCCRNMAMTQPRPGQPGAMPGMGGMDQMPGMQQPSAPTAPPSGSPAPNN